MPKWRELTIRHRGRSKAQMKYIASQHSDDPLQAQKPQKPGSFEVFNACGEFYLGRLRVSKHISLCS